MSGLRPSRIPCNAECPPTATSGVIDKRICEFQPPPPCRPLSAARSHTVWVIVALAIKLDSPGPVLSRTSRFGHDRPNRADILKFRTTVSELVIPGRGPRLTRVGQFLYVTRIDDLPQLFHLLRGDLSLSGA